MPEVQIKRIYEPAEESDGYRVLVDRLWPRGIKKEELMDMVRKYKKRPCFMVRMMHSTTRRRYCCSL